MEYRPPPLPEGLPRFTGKEDIQWWLEEHDYYCWNHYFDTESEWTCVALRHLADDALEWVYQQTWPELNWPTLKEAMIRDFGKHVRKESEDEKPEVQIPIVEEIVVEGDAEEDEMINLNINGIGLSGALESIDKLPQAIKDTISCDRIQTLLPQRNSPLTDLQKLEFSSNEQSNGIPGWRGILNDLLPLQMQRNLNGTVSSDFSKLQESDMEFSANFCDGQIQIDGTLSRNRPPPEPPPIGMKTRTLRTRFVSMGVGIDTVHFHDPDPDPIIDPAQGPAALKTLLLTSPVEWEHGILSLFFSCLLIVCLNNIILVFNCFVQLSYHACFLVCC